MKFKRKLALIGGGGHALSCSEVIESKRTHVIIGFFDPINTAPLAQYGYNYLGSDSDIHDMITHDIDWAISVGHAKSPKRKLELFNLLVSVGAKMPSFVASSCFFSQGSVIGQGSMVFHNAFVNRESV